MATEFAMSLKDRALGIRDQLRDMLTPFGIKVSLGEDPSGHMGRVFVVYLDLVVRDGKHKGQCMAQRFVLDNLALRNDGYMEYAAIRLAQQFMCDLLNLLHKSVSPAEEAVHG